MLISSTTGFSIDEYGTNVNTLCAPATPYSGSCTLCQIAGGGFPGPPTPAKTAYLAGGTTLTDFFCPLAPVCTDSDGDTYALVGGACGPVDCNDANAAVNPGARKTVPMGLTTTATA